MDSGQYDLDRFLAAPESAGPPEWLDEQGHTLGARDGAAEVRLTKRNRSGVLTVRLSLPRARKLGLIRELV